VVKNSFLPHSHHPDIPFRNFTTLVKAETMALRYIDARMAIMATTHKFSTSDAPESLGRFFSCAPSFAGRNILLITDTTREMEKSFENILGGGAHQPL